MAGIQKIRIKRIIKISLFFLFGMITTALIFAFITVHNMINKINLVPDSSDVSWKRSQEVTFDDSIKVQEESAPEELLSIEEQLRANIEENSTPIVYNEDTYNVLLIGSDNRASEDMGRSDAMILISLNKKAKTITATSFLRDIYLQIPEKGFNRLNAAYAFGGAELLMKTIEQNFKIQVNRFISVDFFTFVDVIDALGGISLEVLKAELPEVNRQIRSYNNLTGQESEKDYLTESGTQLLSGKQALAYSRNRYTGNSDFDRTLRQRKVIMQIYEQVEKLNLIELKEFLNEVLPQITTNLSEGEIFSLMLSLTSLADYELDDWSIPMKDTYSSLKVKGMVVLEVDFKKNREELYTRLSLN